MSLLLVLVTILLVYESLKLALMSGLLGFLILLIFVGGLLVLLVSITTLSFQDQNLLSSNFILVISLTMFIPWLEGKVETANLVMMFSSLNIMAIPTVLFLLLQGFTSLSWILLNYKTSIRSM